MVDDASRNILYFMKREIGINFKSYSGCIGHRLYSRLGYLEIKKRTDQKGYRCKMLSLIHI